MVKHIFHLHLSQCSRSHVSVLGIYLNTLTNLSRSFTKNVINFFVIWFHVLIFFACSQAVGPWWSKNFFYCVVSVTWVVCWRAGTTPGIWNFIHSTRFFNTFLDNKNISLEKARNLKNLLFDSTVKKIWTRGPLTYFQRLSTAFHGLHQ